MTFVRVGVIDVGANTLRLLVAASDGRRALPIHTERVQIGLGEYVESLGSIPDEALDAAAKAAKREVKRARSLGAADVRIVITSPGRQAANGDELAAALQVAPGVSVSVLDADEEARLGFVGALSHFDGAHDAESIGVCDVGGGSVQLVVGTREAGPMWARSLDVGSLRLATRHLTDDPGEAPGAERMDAMEAEAELAFADLTPPLPQLALATGGSARGLRKLVGRKLGALELQAATDILTTHSPKKLAKQYGLTRARAHTLPAGALLLAQAQHRLGVPFTVARGGVRDGVAILAFAEAAAA
jgi:exopolyphosphatase/guanosine-5'-triphosphate,3'-diphosphate pyrophosphatase